MLANDHSMPLVKSVTHSQKELEHEQIAACLSDPSDLLYFHRDEDAARWRAKLD